MRHDEGTSLLLKHRKALFAYIFSILRDHHLTEDVFQEVSLVIVRQWDEFGVVRNFWSLAREISRRQALSVLRSRKRDCFLSVEALDALDRGFEGLAGEAEVRKELLRKCIDRLPGNWSRLVRMKYWQGLSVKHAAEQLRRSVNVISVTLNRIRSRLADCVNQQLNITVET